MGKHSIGLDEDGAARESTLKCWVCMGKLSGMLGQHGEALENTRQHEEAL